MTIEKEKLGLSDNPRSIEGAIIWKTENRDTAARLVFGALYQYYRYSWQRDLIDERKELYELRANRPSTVIEGKVYTLADEEIKKLASAREMEITQNYQEAIMQSLSACAKACGRRITPKSGVAIPEGLYKNPLLRITEQSIRDELCKVNYAPSIVLFGPENVDEVIRQNVMWSGMSDILKKYLENSNAIAVIARGLNLADTGAGLERYYGDTNNKMWQSPNDQEMIRRNEEFRRQIKNKPYWA